MTNAKYYEAYDVRYRQVHDLQYQWASDTPTPVLPEILERYAVSQSTPILELGCGEGRDAAHLLRKGFEVTATDISPEAIRYCRKKYTDFQNRFHVLDCVNGTWENRYSFLYAVAVLHMLVEDEDREAFFRFIREHLEDSGLALVCTMGDGTVERSSDISTAFAHQPRVHEESGETLLLAGTSCRMVSWETFLREIEENGFFPVEYGMTAAPPDFPVMMYALIKKN